MAGKPHPAPRWKPAEDDWLRKVYPSVPTTEIAQRCGRTIQAVRARAHNLGLSKEVKAPNNGCFKSGLVPWNKGVSHCPPGSEKTHFKPGQLPHNTKPPGVYLYDDHGRKYYRIKLEGERKLRLLHIYLWEKANGPVPAGHVVYFRNGDSLDCRLENLDCIDRMELMRRNGRQADHSLRSRKAARTRTGKTITYQVLMNEY